MTVFDSDHRQLSSNPTSHRTQTDNPNAPDNPKRTFPKTKIPIPESIYPAKTLPKPDQSSKNTKASIQNRHPNQLTTQKTKKERTRNHKQPSSKQTTTYNSRRIMNWPRKSSTPLFWLMRRTPPLLLLLLLLPASAAAAAAGVMARAGGDCESAPAGPKDLGRGDGAAGARRRRWPRGEALEAGKFWIWAVLVEDSRPRR